MQAKYKGAIIGISIFIAVIIIALKIHNPYFLNILGLIFDIVGAFLLALYVILGNETFESNCAVTFMTKLLGQGDVFGKTQRMLAIFGFVLIFLGFILQIYANWIQWIVS